jgi:hypothetical protein
VSGGARRTAEPEPPPLPGGWDRLYAVVIAGLVLAIVALGLITRGCS